MVCGVRRQITLKKFIVCYNMVNVVKVATEEVQEVPCKEQWRKNIMEVPKSKVGKNAWFSLIKLFSHNTPHEKNHRMACSSIKKWIYCNSHKGFGYLKVEASVLFTASSFSALEIEAEMYCDWFIWTYLWNETQQTVALAHEQMHCWRSFLLMSIS